MRVSLTTASDQNTTHASYHIQTPVTLYTFLVHIHPPSEATTRTSHVTR